MSIYQHFRKHEHPFVDQVLSWKEQVERNFASYATDFLDPREQQIVHSIIGTTKEEIKFSLFGGFEQSERKQAILAPYYEELNEGDFEIVLLEATFPKKFMKLEHRDVLGAFMSMGIERKKLGDIIIADGIFQLFVSKDISTYVQMNLTQIKQASIQFKQKAFADVIKNKEAWAEQNQTVSSLRLDVLVKEIYRLSRKDAGQLIKNNRVKVNFTEVDDPSVQLIENDLISVRGHGRSKLVEIDGMTRKSKIRIVTAKLKE